jgi:hypothetical protein
LKAHSFSGDPHRSTITARCHSSWPRRLLRRFAPPAAAR